MEADIGCSRDEVPGLGEHWHAQVQFWALGTHSAR